MISTGIKAIGMKMFVLGLEYGQQERRLECNIQRKEAGFDGLLIHRGITPHSKGPTLGDWGS